MYGRFLRCLVLAVSILFTQTAFAKKSANKKDHFTVNGFSINFLDNNKVRGLRLKAKGDMLLRKKFHAAAIQPYELALQYIPNEADIYFSLGDIYANERIYKMAVRYYEIAAHKYTLPENAGKTQKYYYLSLVYQGKALLKLNKTKEANKIAYIIRSNHKYIVADFGEITNITDGYLNDALGDSYLFAE